MRRWLRRHVAWLDTADDTDRDPPADDRHSFDTDFDVLLELLKNDRRRRVIELLPVLDDGDGVDLGRLCDELAVRETDATDVAQVTGAERKRVYVSLYQSHAPRLDDAGLLELGPDGLVTATEATWAARAWLVDAQDAYDTYAENGGPVLTANGPGGAD